MHELYSFRDADELPGKTESDAFLQHGRFRGLINDDHQVVLVRETATASMIDFLRSIRCIFCCSINLRLLNTSFLP